MKIIADNKEGEVEIVRNDPDDPYSGYWIGLTVKTVDGLYTGANGCVHFSGLDDFLRLFTDFVRTRQGTVTLELTEGCRLQFFRWNNKGEVGVNVAVSKYSVGYDPMRTTPVTVTGTLKLDTEYINNLLNEFKKMKTGEPSSPGYK